MLEGRHLVRDALEHGHALEAIFVERGAHDIDPDGCSVPVHELEPGVLAKITDTVTPQPVVAIAPMPDDDAGVVDRTMGDGGMVVVLAGVSDPGNAGTLVRIAEAAGVGAVLFCDEAVDPFAPKCVRASAGSIMHVPVTSGARSVQLLEAIGEGGGRRLAAGALRGDPYDRTDLTGPLALVLGSEVTRCPRCTRTGARRLDARTHARTRGVAQRRRDGRGHLLRGRTAAPARRARELNCLRNPHDGRVFSHMTDDIARIATDGTARIATVDTLDELHEVDIELLGKRGAVAQQRQQLGTLAPDERKEIGRALNDARTALQSALDAKRAQLEAEARAEQLEVERLDLTEFTHRGRRYGHKHLVTQAWERLENVFIGLGFQVAEGPEAEDDWHNFGALNFPPDHPARDMYDTLYLDYGEPGSTLLRTHTSPVQIRVMQELPPPIYMVMPGRVFRQDTADATHMPVFHQIEGLVIDKGITFAHLAGTIDAFSKAFFGGDFASRLRPAYFPFTEPSAEFDILRPDGSYMELGGCGMVHPNVLTACGLDPEEWQGFAFGFGIDRFAKERHGVDDLRDLFSNDIRFLEQF